MDKGNLYIVAGPIGNLEDTTYRAVSILEEVELILSEDTRETEKLLSHFNIKTPQISYRDQNHNRIISHIIEILDQGKSIALVSDSGTPLISDPGYKLVSELRAKKYNVYSIPGPSSVISALSVSGLPTDKFIFLGFLPKGSGQREKLLRDYGTLDATLTIFESPYRIRRLLSEISEILGNRYVFLAKDLTKVFEDTKSGYIQEILGGEDIKEKGEYVLLVAKTGFSGGKYGPTDTTTGETET